MDKFIIGNNEMGAKPEMYYITHLLNPVAIIAVREGLVSFPPGSFFRTFDYNEEDWTLKIHFLFTQEFDADQHGKLAEDILKKSWHWYKAYMEWEDQQK